MDPITVRWNGPTTVENTIEEPDSTLTCGKFLTAFSEAHGIVGDVHFRLGEEDVPADSPIDLLAGETVDVVADAPADKFAKPSASPGDVAPRWDPLRGWVTS